VASIGTRLWGWPPGGSVRGEKGGPKSRVWANLDFNWRAAGNPFAISSIFGPGDRSLAGDLPHCIGCIVAAIEWNSAARKLLRASLLPYLPPMQTLRAPGSLCASKVPSGTLAEGRHWGGNAGACMDARSLGKPHGRHT